MQRPIYTGVILISILLAVVSCQRNPAWPILQQAEALMEAHPETALRLLEDSIQPATLSGKAQADWCLLITQARDKNWVEHTSDSLIRIACEYYEDHPDPERSTLAYFYMGRVNYDTGSTLLAQDYFLRALETGESSKNIQLKALIYNQLGELYTNQIVYHQAILFLQQAFDLYEQVKDTEGMSFAMRDIGRVYNQLDSIDAALAAYQEALKYEHPNSRQSVLSELADIYAKKKEYEQALACLYESLQLVETAQDPSPLYLAFGTVFRKMGENDSARFYLNKCTDSRRMNTRAGSYYHLYHLNKDEQDWRGYALMQEKYEKLNDSILNLKFTDQVRKANELFHYQQAEDFKLKHLASQQNIYQMALIILLLLGGLGWFYAYFLRWKREKEFQLKLQAIQLEENKDRIKELITQLANAANTQEQNDNLKDQIKRIQIRNEKIIRKKEEKRKVLVGKFRETSVFKDLTSIMDNKKHWSTSDQINLEKWVDQEYPFLKQKLDKNSLHLKPDYRMLCYLLKVGFTPTEASALYKVNLETISRWRKSIYEILSGTTGSAADLDPFIEEI